MAFSAFRPDGGMSGLDHSWTADINRLA
ncbi:Putative nucleoside triphosphatase [Salmonella enterica subsp. enterica serovar Typhimurium]|nr:not available [Salmonella enterica]AUC51410.1 Putative nucleoside triphosphatase [Salmonella enterica subsp. enterica serovar Typhimurium]